MQSQRKLRSRVSNQGSSRIEVVGRKEDTSGSNTSSITRGCGALYTSITVQVRLFLEPKWVRGVPLSTSADTKRPLVNQAPKKKHSNAPLSQTYTLLPQEADARHIAIRREVFFFSGPAV